jgi:protein disulfide-isomerase
MLIDKEALDRTALSLIGHAPLLKTNSEVLINRFRITSFPKLIVLRDGKASYYNALSPRDMRDHRRILSWMQSVWLPMVPELSAANSHQVMQGRTVVLAILDRTLKDFEQTKDKMKAAALEWLDVRAAEDKAEKQDLREKKESKIEEAEEKGDKRAIEKAKGIQVVVKPKKEVGFAWVDGVFWGRWCRGTYGVDVRETGPRIIINEQDVYSLFVLTHRQEKRYWDVNLQGKSIQPTTENIIETLQAVLANPPKIKPISTVGRLETMYRAVIAFIRSHPYGLASCVAFIVLAAALWVRRGMKRKFGTLSAPSFSLHEKSWGSASNGSDGHTRQPSGKGASLGKFD